jgi:hypothetical protein
MATNTTADILHSKSLKKLFTVEVSDSQSILDVKKTISRQSKTTFNV